MPRGMAGEFVERKARLDQRGQRFVPHIVAIGVGGTVDFPNSDPFFHNVFSLSDVRSFDLGRYATGKSKAVRFDKPGVVRVFCDIHAHMSAFIFVFAHPYFDVTDGAGRYRIDGVPPGTHALVLWNETIEPETRQVTVPDGGEVEVNFASPRAGAEVAAASRIEMLSSLSNRIFLASALLAVLSIGAALYLVNVVVTRQAEAELEESLVEAGELVTQFQSLFFTALLREARIVADVSALKAAVDTKHGPTVAAAGGRVPRGRPGRRLRGHPPQRQRPRGGGRPGLPPEQSPTSGSSRRRWPARSAVDVWSQGSGLLQVGQRADLHRSGAARGARHAHRRPAPRSRRWPIASRRSPAATSSSSTAASRAARRCRPTSRRRCWPCPTTAACCAATVDGEEYEAVRRRLVDRDAGDAALAAGAGDAPLAIVARSRTAHLAFLRNLHSALARPPRWRCWWRRSSASPSPAR